jgi:hypothetical protein
LLSRLLFCCSSFRLTLFLSIFQVYFKFFTQNCLYGSDSLKEIVEIVELQFSRLFLCKHNIFADSVSTSNLIRNHKLNHIIGLSFSIFKPRQR